MVITRKNDKESNWRMDKETELAIFQNILKCAFIIIIVFILIKHELNSFKCVNFIFQFKVIY